MTEVPKGRESSRVCLTLHRAVENPSQREWEWMLWKCSPIAPDMSAPGIWRGLWVEEVPGQGQKCDSFL